MMIVSTRVGYCLLLYEGIESRDCLEVYRDERSGTIMSCSNEELYLML